jgi:hypothetical protein
MSERIPCLNPKCRHTASREKYPEATMFVCADCWRVMPPDFRQRDKVLQRRRRKLRALARNRSFNRPERRPKFDSASDMFGRASDALWIAINHYFTASERPVGIEDFLKENGLV